VAAVLMGTRVILGGLAFFVALFANTDSQSAVVISSQSTPTTGLANYTTFTLTATSDVAGEFISVVDFIGDKDNTNPATARGFFGTMNQLEAGGPGTTVFNNFNFIFPNNGIADSQFKESNTNVVVAASAESTTFLRAGYAYAVPSAQSLEFVQLTLPDAAAGTVNYRGVFSVVRSGTIVDLPEITGQIIRGHNLPPSIQPILRDVTLGVNHGELANLQLLAMDEFLPADELVWSDLVVAGPGKNPNFPNSSDPQLDSDGVFSWNPNGWRGGQYQFTVTVADERNETTEVALTVNLTVPEPTSCMLMAGLCLAILPAIRQRRRVVG
jgi:hypothetical protein